MDFLWHIELHRDYHRFPDIFWKSNAEIARPCVSVGKLCKQYELWRRRQLALCALHVYLSHFDGFIGSSNLPSDFFDFTVNILQRRHQSFIAHRGVEPVVLLSPGVSFRTDFVLESYVQEAIDTGKLVMVRAGAFGGELSGLWVIPSCLQDEFCKPLLGSVVERYAGDDLGYWLGVAKRTTGIIDHMTISLDNEVPQYATTSLPWYDDLVIGEPLSAHHYPAWTREEFAEWASNQRFRFASTMRSCPHEYILLGNGDLESQKQYLMAIDCLHRNTFVNQWFRYFQFAVCIDGHRYWYSEDTVSLLNRTSEALQHRIFAEDGKDRFGRKIRTEAAGE